MCYRGLLRYRDEGGDDWANIIDMLTMHPDGGRLRGCSGRLMRKGDENGRGKSGYVSRVDDWTPMEKVGLWIIFLALGRTDRVVDLRVLGWA